MPCVNQIVMSSSGIMTITAKIQSTEANFYLHVYQRSSTAVRQQRSITKLTKNRTHELQTVSRVQWAPLSGSGIPWPAPGSVVRLGKHAEAAATSSPGDFLSFSRRCYSDMDIPIPKTLAIWASPFHITLAISVRVRVTVDLPQVGLSWVLSEWGEREKASFKEVAQRARVSRGQGITKQEKNCKALLESLGQGMPVLVVATSLLSEGRASTGYEFPAFNLNFCFYLSRLTHSRARTHVTSHASVLKNAEFWQNE